MRRELQRTANGVGMGLDITAQEQEYLSKAINVKQIFENLESLNEEIEDSNKAFGEQEVVQPVKQEPKQIQKPTGKKVAKVQRVNRVTVVQKKEEPMKEEMSFEEELSQISKKSTPPIKEPVQTELTQEQIDLINRERVFDAIAKSGGPSKAQIEQWRKQHGAIYITPFKETDIYIYTHLTRSMWQSAQDFFEKMKDSKDSRSEDDFKELIVKRCLLWPAFTVELKTNSKAGLINSLFDSIWMQSYFLSNQAIAAITIEL